MKGIRALILRVTGIIVFMLVLSVFLETIERSIQSFAFFISSPELGWGLFYVFTSIVFATFFLFALFSSALSAIFAGKKEFINASWSSALLALFSVSFFATVTLITGVEDSDKTILTLSEAAIFLLILYSLVLFLCYRKEEGFFWANIFSRDKNFFMCIKVYLIMLAVLEAASFLYAHKLLDS